MKKILIFILSLFMLTACGKKDNSDSEPPETKSGLITPDENDPEYALGEYRYSPSGIKLYYNADEYPEELMLTLEKYFRAFEENNFEDFRACLYPEYIDCMEEFLEKEYEYGLDKSFKNQRDSLYVSINGDFKITRIKAELSEGDPQEFFDYYFEMLDDTFEKDFYSEVKNNTDKLYNVTFYVMAENEQHEETLMLGERKAVYAEKDGVYYTFG